MGFFILRGRRSKMNYSGSSDSNWSKTPIFEEPHYLERQIFHVQRTLQSVTSLAQLQEPLSSIRSSAPKEEVFFHLRFSAPGYRSEDRTNGRGLRRSKDCSIFDIRGRKIEKPLIFDLSGRLNEEPAIFFFQRLEPPRLLRSAYLMK